MPPFHCLGASSFLSCGSLGRGHCASNGSCLASFTTLLQGESWSGVQRGSFRSAKSHSGLMGGLCEGVVSPCASGLEPLWISLGIVVQEGDTFIEASTLPGDLYFDVLAIRSVPGEVSPPMAIPSKLAAWLEPCGGTLPTSKAASSEFVPGARSAPSNWAFVTAA